MTKRLLAAALAAAFGACALAQDAPRPALPGRATLEQKEALVRRLLTDSPAVARIEASGDEDAKTYFRRARERHAEAAGLLAAGDLVTADTQLNDALWMVGKARQRVPDTMRRAIELRFQNRQMLLSIESLLASYQRHLARMPGATLATVADDAPLKRIAIRLDEAKSFAQSEQVQETNAMLHSVERDLMVALDRVLGSSTIEYAQRFETQAEEWGYEASRNRAYRELMPVAREELKPAREAAALMERHAAVAANLFERAEKSAARKDYAAAISAARQSTSFLQSALGAAGLAMPRDAESQ